MLKSSRSKIILVEGIIIGILIFYVMPIIERFNSILFVTILLGAILILYLYFWFTIIKNEEKLYSEKEQLRVTIQSISDGVVTTDTYGKIININKAGESITGYKAVEIVGKLFEEVFSIVHEKTNERAKDPVKEVLKTDKICEIENHAILISKDGIKRYISDGAAPIKDKKNKTIGVVVVFRDVTERKKFEKVLKQDLEIIENMQTGVYVYHLEDINDDRSLKLISANRASTEALGIKRDDVIGLKIDEVFPSLRQQGIPEKFANVIRTEEPFETDRFNYSDVNIIESCFNFKAYPLPENCVCILFEDITEKAIIQDKLKRSEEHYKMLFDSMLNGYAIHEMLFDKEGNPQDYKFLDINPAFENMTGLKRDLVIGKTLKEILPDSEKYWIDAYGAVVITGKSIKYENYSGELKKHYEVYAFRPMENHFSVIVSDITERKALEKSLYEEKERLRITFESIGDGVITTDNNRVVTNLNKIAEEYIGLKAEEARGKLFEEVFEIANEITGNNAKDPVKEVLTKDIICELENHTILTSKQGIKRHIADSAAPIKNSEGKTEGVVMVFRDVTEKKKHIDEIKYLSYHDALTGLYNRRYFTEELIKLNSIDNHPISIIMGDVNGLKLLNDVYGHEEGDKLLFNISRIFERNCRADDIIARIGGDEFAVIMPRTTKDEANEIYNKIKEDSEKSDSNPIILSISMGVATKEQIECCVSDTLRKAEDIMYTHKLLEGKSVRNTIIASLQKTLFEKSCETEEHGIRMLEIGIKFGQSLNLSEHEIDKLRLLAMLHDIGKICMPEQILNKKEKLTQDEWVEIKKHPEIGYRIAQASSELSHIAELILTHHESWDGSGYPQGIIGEQIPRLSRIISIIDAYDVMTNGRLYKDKMTKQEALAEINRCSAKQFDPYLVDKFISLDV